MNTILSFGLTAGVFALSQSVAADSPHAAPPLRYDSAFTDYKPWQDIRPAEWREVNDAVREAAAQGTGHAGHGSLAAPGSASSPARPATPPEAAHGAHRLHGGTK
jgi:hypothetical protein